jgi:hypothetical protein
MFAFSNGHSCTWADTSEPAKRPVWNSIDEIRARVGDQKARWMLGLRQLMVFPNMQINDAAGVILRVMRPLAVNLTEMNSHCLAPIGESAQARAHRLRQFEDFFNPGGMATPDDTVTYEDCQAGFPATGFNWVEGYSRGTTRLPEGAGERAAELGLKPSAGVRGKWNLFNEVGLQHPYREWARLLEAGISGRPPYK